MAEITDNLLFQRTLLPMMHAGLDAYALRQKAIANNLANSETDGYQRRAVRFEEALGQALDSQGDGLTRTHPDHLPHPSAVQPAAPELVVDEQATYYNGHNNVDVDQEMTELARATLSYRFATRQVRHVVETLDRAIRGGRGA
jgi:flagellar basal-body rod protein FlgB